MNYIIHTRFVCGLCSVFKFGSVVCSARVIVGCFAFVGLCIAAVHVDLVVVVDIVCAL